MLRSRTAGALIVALAFLVAAPATAGAWSGRSHWRFGSAHAWLFAPDPGLHTLPTGDGPDATLFDPDTRTLYVANYVSSTVSVLDPGGRTAASVPVGAGPVGLALNDRTLYVTNLDGRSVSVIDAARCNARTAFACTPVATVDAGGPVVGAAVDPLTAAIYIARPDDGLLSVIDGAHCNRAITSGCTPRTTPSIAGGIFPAVDATTRTLYVPGADGLAVVDLRSGALAATASAGDEPFAAVVDPATRTVYVANPAGLALVDGARCNALDTSGCGLTPPQTATGPGSNNLLALDRATRTLYVPAADTDTVAVIDTTRCNVRTPGGCGTRWPTLQTGSVPLAVAVDPTGPVYVADNDDASVAVLDGRSCNARSTAGCRDEAPSRFVDDAFNLALDPAVRTMYVTHANLHDLVMFDTSRCSAVHVERCDSVVAPVAGVSGPYDIAYDNNTLYATNQGDRTLVLIDPARCNARRATGCAPVGPAIHLPHAVNVSVNPASHAIYVTSDDDGTISVIDGRHCRVGDFSACTARLVPAGVNPFAAAADPVTGTVYVSHHNDEGGISVLDGTRIVATIATAPSAQKLEVDAGARKLYVGGGEGRVSVIDIRTCNARNTSGCHPVSIPAGRWTQSLAIDSTTHTVYTADTYHSTSTVIGDGRVKATVPIGYFPWDVAVDPASNTVYVTDNAEGRVSFFATR